MGARGAGGREDRRLVLVALVAAERDRVAGGQRVAQEVLEEHRDVGPQRGAAGVGGVGVVQQHAAAVGHVETAEQLGERRLARAVGAHERDDLARLDRERDAAQRGDVAARIGEPHVLGRHAARPAPGRPRRGRGSGRLGCELDEGEVVLDQQRRLEQVLRGDPAVGQALAEQDHRPRGGTRRGHRELVADRERDEHGERRADDRRARDPGGERIAQLAVGDRAQLVDPLGVEAIVPRPQEARELHRPDLLGGVALGEQLREVVALAVARGQRVGEAVEEVGLAARERERRREGEHRERQQHRLQDGECDEAADDAGARLQQPHQPVHDVAGAHRAGLGTGHPVVEGRLVERGELDGARDVEDLRLRAARHELRQELVLAADERLGDHEHGRYRCERGEVRCEPRPGARVRGGEHPLERAAAEQHERPEPDRGERLERDRGHELGPPRRPRQPQRARHEPRQLAPRAV